jgi:hypothetical protein
MGSEDILKSWLHYAREELPIPIDCEGRWMLEAMWIFWRRDKFLAQPGFES